jgi:hypothetical protein
MQTQQIPLFVQWQKVQLSIGRYRGPLFYFLILPNIIDCKNMKALIIVLQCGKQIHVFMSPDRPLL